MALEAPIACPSCGYFTFYDSYEIFPICRWEYDPTQSDFPDTKGANRVTLREGQQIFLKFGVSDLSKKENSRRPLPSEKQDPRWRLLDPL